MQTPWYYRLILALAAPLYWLYLTCKRVPKPQKDTRFGWIDRPGYGQNAYLKRQTHIDRALDVSTSLIWCHAVSLGEVNTIYPILRQLLDEGFCLFITTQTQTGQDRVLSLFAREIATKRVGLGFTPVDTLGVLHRFLYRLRPSMALFVETELWGNALFALKQSGIPTVLVNARLKPKSFARYRLFCTLSRSMCVNLTHILAQDEDTKRRFIALGAHACKISVCPSLKWAIDDPLQTSTFTRTHRRIWCAGSTHQAEENICLDAHRLIQEQHPGALLLLVPRHPERFDAVFEQLQTGFKTVRFTQLDSPLHLDTLDADVLLVDAMGILSGCYQVADVAFVGGSLVDKGGHNPIESAKAGVPVLMGPYQGACGDLTHALSEAGALRTVVDATSLAEGVSAFIDDLKASKRAIQCVAAHKKAAGTQYKILKMLLNQHIRRCLKERL